MNNKEILEIKKQFTPANCCFTKIATCYVNGEKEIVSQNIEAFMSLPEEDAFKYFEIFKKLLSGKIGKTLFEIEYPTREGGCSSQMVLNAIRKDRFSNKELISNYFEEIVENYNNPGNFAIIMVQGIYDIPGKTSDQMEMFDSSDDVFEFVLCCICPVSLSKDGLSYNPKLNDIQSRERDWVVEVPADGFLFPTFTDRTADINSILYYSKKASETQDALQMLIAGNTRPHSIEEEQVKFNEIMNEVQNQSFRNMQKLHENFFEFIAESESDASKKTDKKTLCKILNNSGYEEAQITLFDEQFKSTLGDEKELFLSSVTDKSISIKASNITVKVPTENISQLDTKVINGIPSLVISIPDNQVDVNGITVEVVI